MSTSTCGATEAIARAAREAGARRFLHLSSGGVYGDGRTATPHREAETPNPGTAYERSKLAAEMSVRRGLDDSRVECVILRPAGIFGSGRARNAGVLRRDSAAPRVAPQLGQRDRSSDSCVGCGASLYESSQSRPVDGARDQRRRGTRAPIPGLHRAHGGRHGGASATVRRSLPRSGDRLRCPPRARCASRGSAYRRRSIGPAAPTSIARSTSRLPSECGIRAEWRSRPRFAERWNPALGSG